MTAAVTAPGRLAANNPNAHRVLTETGAAILTDLPAHPDSLAVVAVAA